MSVLVDSHVHIYPHYDAAMALGAFAARVRDADAACGVMMLAEREGVDQFARWAEGAAPKAAKAAMPSSSVRRWRGGGEWGVMVPRWLPTNGDPMVPLRSTGCKAAQRVLPARYKRQRGCI